MKQNPNQNHLARRRNRSRTRGRRSGAYTGERKSPKEMTLPASETTREPTTPRNRIKTPAQLADRTEPKLTDDADHVAGRVGGKHLARRGVGG
jgi:hypothetical protein